MALLKAPYDTEGDKKKKMDRMKKQLAYSDAVKCTFKLPKNIYYELKLKMTTERKKSIQTLVVTLIEEYIKKEQDA